MAFCLHGASQADDDIYVMINAYWEELQFQIQEGTDWLRIVDTSLENPDDFSESGLPLECSTYRVAPRSIVALVRAKTNRRSVESSLTEQNHRDGAKKP